MLGHAGKSLPLADTHHMSNTKEGVHVLKIAMIGAWHVHAPDYAAELRAHPETEIAVVWDNDLARGQESKGKRSGWIQPSQLPKALPSALEQWVGAILRDEPNRFDIDCAVSLTELMDGAYRSHVLGQQVMFPLD